MRGPAHDSGHPEAGKEKRCKQQPRIQREVWLRLQAQLLGMLPGEALHELHALLRRPPLTYDVPISSPAAPGKPRHEHVNPGAGASADAGAQPQWRLSL